MERSDLGHSYASDLLGIPSNDAPEEPQRSSLSGAFKRARNTRPGRHLVAPDGVKWVNLVRFVNLARLFTVCLRPKGGRRRVRFGSGGNRSMMMKGACDSRRSGELPGGRPQMPACTTRPVYIQVRSGRQLVWSTFEEVEHACYCVLLVGNTPRGTTQAVPVAAGGGGGGGGPGGGAVGANPQWNEVFSFPRAVLEVWSMESYGDDVLVGQAELGLAPMLAADNPHPLTAVLELQAIDDDTGQPEPGSCGELVVAAWVEPGPAVPAAAAAAAAAPAAAKHRLAEPWAKEFPELRVFSTSVVELRLLPMERRHTKGTAATFARLGAATGFVALEVGRLQIASNPVAAASLAKVAAVPSTWRRSIGSSSRNSTMGGSSALLHKTLVEVDTK
ncbi:hypothetical protein TSOC_010674 [Tetrabaena socialis]|uniref:C2 domain-containing protein n=1 Tax=Tetrabaena socialis TaxID=47790 RepID=A0A2J7ZSN0_9CHLO|nr:hypothetical protein TSOC_010674 [Tetrabaena socialis]|eukprot:PNH03275.1 hypothetical protein TSOC_010674 [Tetrabaena socialis]